MRVLVYSEKDSPRLQYILSFLQNYYSLPFDLTTDTAHFKGPAILINYSNSALMPGEIHISPSGLMTEKGIGRPKVEVFTYHEFKAFFRTVGTVQFDLFSAIFYLITRYEEYLPHNLDVYKRYDHKQSLAFREGFLQQPLVDIWLSWFKTVLQEKGASIPKREFSTLSTLDIDSAWSYKHKGLRRNFFGALRDLVKGKIRKVLQRLWVLKGYSPDPFDVFESFFSIHREKELLVFVLLPKEKGKFDKPVEREKAPFRELVKLLNSKFKVGLHPSWQAAENPAILEEEKFWLEELIGREVNFSRQHYIRFHLPQTYRDLIEAGIRDEYSMGYGTINGFRASIANSYPWYDLEKEKETALMIHPFCFMDANAHYEAHLKPNEAYDELCAYMDEIRKVGGRMITIFHNSILGRDPEFRSWMLTYVRFIDRCSSEASLNSPVYEKNAIKGN